MFRNVLLGSCFLSAFFVWMVTPAKALSQEKFQGIVAGWNPHDGRLLLGELNCTSCHDPGDAKELLIPRQAPILTKVGRRVTPQYLRAYLKEPQKVKPNTVMPHLLHETKDKDGIEDLVHYLVSQGGPIEQTGSGSSLFQIERGKTLFHQVGCVACHQPNEPPLESKGEETTVKDVDGKAERKPAVLFGKLSMKTTVDELAAFLQNPQHVRPGGRMPSLNLNLGEARTIAAYLLRDQLVKDKKGWGAGLDYAYYEGRWNKVPDFQKLKPKQEGNLKTFDLNAIKLKNGKKPRGNFAVRFWGMISIPEDGKYTFWTTSDDGSYLKIGNQRVVDNDGMHSPREKEGNVELKRGRHPIEVGFMQGGGGYELSVFWQPPGSKKKEPIPAGLLLHGAYAMIPQGKVVFQVDKHRAKRGKLLFNQAGCASCHQIGNHQPMAGKMKGPSLLKVDVDSGCLSKVVKPGLPKYSISSVQRKAIGETLTQLQKKVSQVSHADRIDHTMMALNCYACHPRGDKGGPDDFRDAYFTQIVPADLGNEGRLPPALHVAGAKLTPEGFAGYLLQGERVRYYMGTRMPLFGEKNIGHLPELYAKVDGNKIPSHKPAFSGRLVDDGRRLAGKKAISCISCHSWNGMKAQGVEGMDLIRMPKRLQTGWFHTFLENPQKLTPQTKMPTAWPDGKSFFPEIQGGDMHKQIDALWAYMSVGAKGGIPDGISSGNEYLLLPGKEPIVFRTFIKGVGAHAIAVGYRQRTHVVFDSLRVRMAKVWTGQFLDAKAAWSGRAGQYAPLPSGMVFDFPSGPPFARLESETSKWPGIDHSKKSHPPGWTFLGYRFDKDRMPSFLYRYLDIDIEEKPLTKYLPNKSYLSRNFKLSTKMKVDDLWFRVATGKKIVQVDGSFVVDGRLQFKISSAKAEPVIRNSEDGQELLIPMRFKAAKNGKRSVQLGVEMLW